ADLVVSPSGSCVGMVRSHYPHLFAGTKNESRARDLAARTYELSEFLVDEVGIESLGGRWEGRVTYHDSCPGLRELGLTGQGRPPFGARGAAQLRKASLPVVIGGATDSRELGRREAFAELDLPALRASAAAVREHTVANLDRYLGLFADAAEARGTKVFFAATA